MKRDQVIPFFQKGIPLELNNLIYIVVYLEKQEPLISIPTPVKKILES